MRHCMRGPGIAIIFTREKHARIWRERNVRIAPRAIDNCECGFTTFHYIFSKNRNTHEKHDAYGREMIDEHKRTIKR